MIAPLASLAPFALAVLAPSAPAVHAPFAPAVHAPSAPAVHAPFAPGAAWCGGPDPFIVDLVPTANANGARGEVRLRFADSPYGVTVSADGHHTYAAEVRVTGLRVAGRSLVVWAATPALDRVIRLGVLDHDGQLSGTVTFNKFLVFVTEEASPEVERWSGPILLRGISPSGRMHTMAGHGPFMQESCMEQGFGPAFGPPPGDR